MFIHINGKVAEYAKSERSSSGQYYSIINRPSGDVWFSNEEYLPNDVVFPNWYESREEAYLAAMDYLEEEGCKAYLELYPAPEKGEWDWIAQDYCGKWWGYSKEPSHEGNHTSWACTGRMSEYYISQSPPNPFWRKTLR